MRRISLFSSSLLVIGLTLAGCKPPAEVSARGEVIALVSPDGKRVEVSVEVADDSEEQTEGLMHRKVLGKNDGMLFVYPESQVLPFWMKNTLIPLDVFFFNEDGVLVSLTSMAPCTEDPCPLYPSAQPAMTALEVNAGFAETHGIGVGWQLKRQSEGGS